MKKKNKNDRSFVWTKDEQDLNTDAYDRVNDIAEECEIEVFISGAHEFVERIESTGLEPSDFTVEDYETFKVVVHEQVIRQLIEAERHAFEIVMKNRLFKKTGVKGKIIECCDHCGKSDMIKNFTCYRLSPWHTNSCNKGESAILCDDCISDFKAEGLER